MATVKLVSYVEQNTNMIAGVMNDTAVYGTATPAIVRVGRDVSGESGVYVQAGTQTAVTQSIILDLVNAYHGARVIIKKGTGVGTSVVTVVSGSAAGATVSLLTSGVADEVVAAYDGNSGVWR